jgi:alpha-N-arabinofuranosidase
MKEARAHAMIDVFPTSSLGNVSDGLFSGFLEHLGSCIYGGILPATPTSFPYTSARPCPSVEFIETPTELLSPEGWRTDVMAVLRDELKMNVVRWPGGNYVSSYHWMDGIGPKEERKVRPELAWGAEESNQFGTDEYVHPHFATARNLI